jgi:peptide/nickel transport system ATP-binding protein
MALLDIDHLTLSIGDIAILEDVSLSLERGQVLGLVGESGSGKSLTALSVLGLLPDGSRTGGAVRLNGRDLLALPDAEMNAVRGREIGMVFQEPMTALNPLMSIGDQVAEVFRIHHAVPRAEARRRAAEVLARVGLPAEQAGPGRFPHELSGGQRQRVAIAMAVALKPALVIADEATTALDVTTQAQILDLLTALVREDGCGLILVTHDLAVTARTCDRIAVMQAGRIVEAGEARAVLAAPVHPYTRALMRASTYSPPPRPSRAEGAVVLEARGVVRDHVRRSGLGARTSRLRAVDHVSLQIREGERVGLVGESGCGKSTLLRILLALETPQAGEVLVDGQSFAGARGAALKRLRRRVQVVFQDPYGSFDPRYRVERIVAEPLSLLDTQPMPAERRRKVEAMLVAVGLEPGHADRYPHEFSGGQRQRIAIARALVVEPAVIALDEAVSALDVSVRAQILELLAGLSDRLGLAYLFVSHDLSVVRAVTDRLLVMQAGVIVEEGATEEVFRAPSHPYTARLLAATPQLATGAA